MLKIARMISVIARAIYVFFREVIAASEKSKKTMTTTAQRDHKNENTSADCQLHGYLVYSVYADKIWLTTLRGMWSVSCNDYPSFAVYIGFETWRSISFCQ